jgi:epoxyqueuosine reductase
MIITNKILVEKAKEFGFSKIGFARADLLEKEAGRLNHWLSSGYNAGMKYMERNSEKRRDIKNILPDAKSVVSLAVNYFTKDFHKEEEGFGKVSRYAWGKDYHLIIWDMLEQLEDELKKIDSGFECKSYVDTGPVMDKAWAVKSGIGWMGKHSNVITKEMGSWIFLATIITNYEFDYNEPMNDFCGTCTACIDACPTKAIVNDYVVDAKKCISYLTIENKGEISNEFKGQFIGWIFGCDICQDVCPWNKSFAEETVINEFKSKQNKELNLKTILEMREDDFKMKFEESPVKRAKLDGMQRNAKFLICELQSSK